MARVGRRYSFVGVCVMLLLSLLFVSVALVVDGVGLVKPMLPRLTREARSNFSGCATATGAPCYWWTRSANATRFIVFPCKSICALFIQHFYIIWSRWGKMIQRILLITWSSESESVIDWLTLFCKISSKTSLLIFRWCQQCLDKEQRS